MFSIVATPTCPPFALPPPFGSSFHTTLGQQNIWSWGIHVIITKGQPGEKSQMSTSCWFWSRQVSGSRTVATYLQIFLLLEKNKLHLCLKVIVRQVLYCLQLEVLIDLPCPRRATEKAITAQLWTWHQSQVTFTFWCTWSFGFLTVLVLVSLNFGSVSAGW